MNFEIDMKKLFLYFFLSFSSFSSMAQYHFNGHIVDEQSQPVLAAALMSNINLKGNVPDGSRHLNFNTPDQKFSPLFRHVEFATTAIDVDSVLNDTIIVPKTVGLLEEAVVKAFERNSAAKDAAVAVTVLSKQSLDRFGNNSFVAAVNTVPGVKMDERSPGSYRLSIRGNLLRSTFGVRNVKVYWNGIPFTDASGNTYFNQLSLNNIDRMEIIKGPSGSMYGSGTGGVVLLSSGGSNTTNEKSFGVQATMGSYGLLSANASYQQTGNAATSISVSHQQSNGYRNHSNMRRDVAHYTGSYVLNNRQTVHANVFYSDLFYQTPGGLTRAELNTNPRLARPAAGIFQSAATQKAALYLKTIYAGFSHEYRFNNRWNNTSSVYSSYTDFKNPSIRNYEKKYESGIGGRTVFQYRAGSFFTGTFGAELQRGTSHIGVFGNRAGVKDTLQFRAEIASRQANVFAQADVELPLGFFLSGGMSYNKFYYEYQKKNIATTKQSSQFNPQLVPRISLMKKFAAVNIYAAISKGYSVPSIDEVVAGNDAFNAGLKAETAINYEVGLKGDIIKNKLWTDAAFYIFGLQNTIVGRRNAGGGDFYTNAGKTRQRGAELSLHYLPINRVTGFLREVKFMGNYTHINARFKNYQQGSIKYDGNKLTGTPPNVFVFTADLTTSAKIYSNISYNYTDHIPLNDANSFYAGAYHLAFVKVGYRSGRASGTEFNYFVTAERSFNRPFSLGNDLNAAGNRYFNPSAPQNFSVGIQCRFHVK